MKKTIFSALVLSTLMVNAQVSSERYGRTGINTTEPRASFEVRRHDGLPSDRAQGVLFPKFSTAERSLFTNVEVGTMIFNTDQKCIEMYMGVVSGVHQWSCLPDAGSSQQQNISITPVGFEGSFVQGVALSTSNKAKFKIVNNSFAAVNNVDFSSAVTIQNGTANITATGVNANNVSLASGAERILEYTLSGSPVNGTLTANFSRLGLTASQNTTVGMGRASFSSADNTSYVVSLIYNTTQVQGKINNTTNKLTIKIPYTGGQGSYNAFTNTQTTAAGQGNDINPLTLTIPQGNFGVTGELTATITVGGDGEYLVKQMAPGQEYVIATFPVNMNGSTTNVVIKGIGGVPDRRFSESTNHKFIYIPIEVTGANGYRKTWLNNNLGAEYADANNPRGNFNPTKQATAYNDHLAYGSLYQWQRPSDGHELITWTSATAGTVVNSHQSGLWNATDWKPNHSKFILRDGSSDYSWVTDAVNRNTSYHNLWQSNGANNPCPVGYHVPTKAEWVELHTALGGSNGYAHWESSALKLPAAGWRNSNGGTLYHQSSHGNYWSSEADSSYYSWYFFFGSSGSSTSNYYNRASGFSVRCLKDS